MNCTMCTCTLSKGWRVGVGRRRGWWVGGRRRRGWVGGVGGGRRRWWVGGVGGGQGVGDRLPLLHVVAIFCAGPPRYQPGHQLRHKNKKNHINIQSSVFLIWFRKPYARKGHEIKSHLFQIAKKIVSHFDVSVTELLLFYLFLYVPDCRN